MQLLGLSKIFISLGIQRPIPPGQFPDLLPVRRLQRLAAEGSEVYIIPVRAEMPRLGHVGRGAVHPSCVQRRDIHAVQGVRVSGAENVVYLQAPFLRGRADPAHEAGFASAGTALDHMKKGPLLRRKALVQRQETLAGVPAQKTALNHGILPFPFIPPYFMMAGAAL